MATNSQVKNPPPAVTPKEFLVKVPGISLPLTVRSESQGRNRPRRYWFSHPTKKEKDGRALRVRDESRVLIQALAETAIKESVGNKVEMTRAEYEEFLNYKTLMAELEQELHDTGLTPKRAIYQSSDPMRRLHAEGIGLSEALVAAMSLFIPETPMTPQQVLEGLLPALRDNQKGSNKDLERRCRPLIKTFQQEIHHVTVPELEKLSRDCEDGIFLSEEDKKRILKKNKRTAPPIVNGRPKWLSDKELKHIEAAWGRIFIRAEAIGAWPHGREIPTRAMERRQADPPDHITISPEDWGILLPALSKPQRLFAALSISDVRVAEMNDLGPDCIIDDANGMPESIDVTPQSAKGNKGHRTGRNTLLTAYASALVHISRPDGDTLFPCTPEEMREQVYKLARQLGIQTDDNFIRRFHDTYIYAFVNAARDQRTPYSSHSIQMINSIYRNKASFAAALQVLTTFPADMPDHLKKWVSDWANRYREVYRGGPLPAQGTPDSLNMAGSPDGSETKSAPEEWESEEEEGDVPESAKIPPATGASPEVIRLSRQRISGPKTRWGRVKALPIETLKALLPRKSALEWSTRFDVSAAAIRKFCREHSIETKEHGELPRKMHRVSDAEFLELSKTLTKAELIEHTGYAPGYVKQRGTALGVVWQEAPATPQHQAVEQTSN